MTTEPRKKSSFLAVGVFIAATFALCLLYQGRESDMPAPERSPSAPAKLAQQQPAQQQPAQQQPAQQQVASIPADSAEAAAHSPKAPQLVEKAEPSKVKAPFKVSRERPQRARRSKAMKGARVIQVGAVLPRQENVTNASALAPQPASSESTESNEPDVDLGKEEIDGELAQAKPAPEETKDSAPITITFREDLDFIAPRQVDIYIDGELVGSRTITDSVDSNGSVAIYKGDLEPGPHQVDMRASLAGQSSVFSYVESYKFKLKHRTTIDFGKGGTNLLIQLREKDGITTGWENRIGVDVQVSRNPLASR